jgi:dipeptide/tripeptide permease
VQAEIEAQPAVALLPYCTVLCCCRLAYYGLATNFVTYLTHIMGVDAATAAIEVGSSASAQKKSWA